MNTWFTSDTHFGHRGILYHRPQFSSVEEMNETLIDNWNSRVTKNDTVYHLGDVSFQNRLECRSTIGRLNGHIHIIKGNHDRDQMKYVREMVVDIRDYAEITLDSQKIIMCHYPLLSWNKGHYGSWMLHGHTHGSVNYMDKETTRLDVGVDNFAFAPVLFEDVQEIMKHRKYLVVDHHHNPYEVTREYE